MTESLAKYDASYKINDEQLKAIKNQIAKGATDDELLIFKSIAEKYGLDPFLKEIWFIKQAKKSKDKNGNWDYKRLPNGEIDYSGAETLIYTSRDGYLKVAQRDDNFLGITSMAVREGDEFSIDAENYKVTHKFGLKRGKIIGAWAKVDHKQRKPVICFADFSEYNTGKSVWNQYPTAMIIKVAEVFALKRQFGITGLVTREEMVNGMHEEEFDTDITILPTDGKETELEITCSDCGQVIKGNERADAKVIIDYAIEHFGVAVCAVCGKQRKEKEWQAKTDKFQEELKASHEVIEKRVGAIYGRVTNGLKWSPDDFKDWLKVMYDSKFITSANKKYMIEQDITFIEQQYQILKENNQKLEEQKEKTA